MNQKTMPGLWWFSGRLVIRFKSGFMKEWLDLDLGSARALIREYRHHQIDKVEYHPDPLFTGADL